LHENHHKLFDVEQQQRRIPNFLPQQLSFKKHTKRQRKQFHFGKFTRQSHTNQTLPHLQQFQTRKSHLHLKHHLHQRQQRHFSPVFNLLRQHQQRISLLFIQTQNQNSLR
jgi:hypothetical protein